MASARPAMEAPLDADEDRSLLQMVRRGEPEGATELFRKYSAPLLRYADRLLGSRAEAEEVAQEVFLKLIARVDQYDGRAPVASWLFAIAANACRDRLRKSGRRTSVSLEAVAETAAQDPPADRALLESERRRLVRRALLRLSEDQREALILARYHDLPYAEIARTLAISEGAVKTRIFRAMEKLKDVFSEGDSRWTAVTS
ncbi:MAG TPA: RNA polymerase sigma factor [Thermoanaerobaculia bacterium]|nr:RNA polymerase sigma factor [Thermoanaerobaculia bacterium]